MAGVGRGARRMAFTLRGGADEQKRLQGGAHWQYTEYNNAIDTSSSSRDSADILRPHARM